MGTMRPRRETPSILENSLASIPFQKNAVHLALREINMGGKPGQPFPSCTLKIAPKIKYCWASQPPPPPHPGGEEGGGQTTKFVVLFGQKNHL